MMLKEKAAKIRKEIKSQLGYTAKQVSVRSVHGTELKVTVKDITIDLQQIEKIASQFEDIHRCEATNEILLGGNTFVNVGYDWQVVHEAKQERLAEAEAIMEAHQHLGVGVGEVVAKSGNRELVYFPNTTTGSSIDILENVSKEFDGQMHTLQRWTAHNEWAIAEALVMFEARYTAA